MLLKERCIDIVMELANNSQPIKISEFVDKFKVSNRTIRYDLDLIDEFLKENDIHPLERKPNVGVMLILTDEEKIKLMENLKMINMRTYVLSQDERKELILGELIQQEGYVTIDQLADKLMVSRGTLISDLKNVRRWLEDYELELRSASKHGIRIAGDEKKIRHAAKEILTKNMSIDKVLTVVRSSVYNNMNVVISNQLKDFFNEDDVKFVEECLKVAENELQNIFSDEAFLNLVVQILISIKRIEIGKEVVNTDGELHALEITKEFVAASNLAKMFEEHFHINMSADEIGYIALNMLSSSVTAVKTSENEKWIDSQLLTRDIIENVSKDTNVDFTRDSQLFEGFLEHLRPAIYRIQNGLKVKNPLLKEIRSNFFDLFEAVKENVEPIEKYAKGTFDDAEIAYFTMHFGASMERIRFYQRSKKNILVVCQTGIGTAKLLSAELQSLFDVDIVDTVAYRNFKEVLNKKEVDLIVSTLPIEVDKITSIKVNAILNDKDISLLNKYLKHFTKPEITVNKLLDIINKYCTVTNYNGLIEELSKLFNADTNIYIKGVVQPMLKDLLTKDTIRVNIDAKDWEDAIRKGGDLLEKNGSIEHRYVDGMVETMKEIGPYIVIAPGIAMPHARPESGVKKIGMSLMTLKNPINFGNKENDPVSLVVCLCAIDHTTHLKAMSELVQLLGDEEKIKKIKAAENVGDILVLLQDEK